MASHHSFAALFHRFHPPSFLSDGFLFAVLATLWFMLARFLLSFTHAPWLILVTVILPGRYVLYGWCFIRAFARQGHLTNFSVHRPRFATYWSLLRVGTLHTLLEALPSLTVLLCYLLLSSPDAPTDDPGSSALLLFNLTALGALVGQGFIHWRMMLVLPIFLTQSVTSSPFQVSWHLTGLARGTTFGRWFLCTLILLILWWVSSRFLAPFPSDRNILISLQLALAGSLPIFTISIATWYHNKWCEIGGTTGPNRQ